MATWISEHYLLSACEGLDADYLRTKCRYRFTESLRRPNKKTFPPDTGASWRWAKVGGQFYYDYNRIPEKYRTQLPALQELQNGVSVPKGKHTELVNRALTQTYKAYLRSYPGISEAKAVQLARAAALIQEAVEHIQETGYDVRNMAFFIELCEDVRGINYLPSSHRVMKSKILAVLNAGSTITDVIDLPRAGNSNAKKYDDPEIMAWMIQMRNMPHNYTNAHIARKLRTLCELSAKPVPSASWFNNELAKPFTKFLTAPGRWGKNGKRGARYRGYIPVENAMFAGDCWQADGTRVNLIGHKGKDGKQEFLYIIAVRDVYSGDLLGWHLDTKEDRWGWICAIKMAVACAGYTPWELVIDRFPGHNTNEWELAQKRLELTGTTVTITSAATGKARIERMFGTLQTVFMQDSDYYYGEGVQSRRDYAHRSEEYLTHMQRQANREGWDFDAAFKEANRIIEAYRSTPLSHYSRKYATVQQCPRELHEQCEKPHTAQVEPWDFVGMFGLEKRVKMRSEGIIKTEIQRVEYFYIVQQYETIAHYKEVALCYDMDDLGTVYLFEPTLDVNRKYLGEAQEQQRAQMYGPNADRKVGKAKERLKEIQTRRKEDLEALTAAGNDLAFLLGAASSKDDVANAENAWLLERAGEWKDTGKARVLVTVPADRPILDDDDEDEPLKVDVRNMY